METAVFAGAIELSPEEVAAVLAMLVIGFVLLLTPGAALAGAAAASTAGPGRRLRRFVGGALVGYLVGATTAFGLAMINQAAVAVVLGVAGTQALAALILRGERTAPSRWPGLSRPPFGPPPPDAPAGRPSSRPDHGRGPAGGADRP